MIVLAGLTGRGATRRVVFSRSSLPGSCSWRCLRSTLRVFWRTFTCTLLPVLKLNDRHQRPQRGAMTPGGLCGCRSIHRKTPLGRQRSQKGARMQPRFLWKRYLRRLPEKGISLSRRTHEASRHEYAVPDLSATSPISGSERVRWTYWLRYNEECFRGARHRGESLLAYLHWASTTEAQRCAANRGLAISRETLRHSQCRRRVRFVTMTDVQADGELLSELHAPLARHQRPQRGPEHVAPIELPKALLEAELAFSGFAGSNRHTQPDSPSGWANTGILQGSSARDTHNFMPNFMPLWPGTSAHNEEP